MAAFEVLVPPLERYEEQQAAFGIEPEELALLGLSMIGRLPDKYVKSAFDIHDYGYVTPYERNGQDYFLRGLYLPEDEAIDVIGIPRRPEELTTHLVWHQGELQRLQKHGLSVARHLPVIVKDEERWGEAGYGIFTLAEAVEGVSLETSIKSRLFGSQKPAEAAIRKLFSYYQDSDRPSGVRHMRDVGYMRQYIGQCLVDLDPLQDNARLPEELSKLTTQSELLRSREGKALHDRIYTEWLRQVTEIVTS